MLAYSTAATDQARGWDAFDSMVLRAVSQHPTATVDQVATLLPAGIAFHLIERALRLACDAGRVVAVVSDGARRFKATGAGERLVVGTLTRPGHQAAA